MPLSDAEFNELRAQGRDVMRDHPDDGGGWAASAASDMFPGDPARAEALHEGMMDVLEERESAPLRR